MAVIALSGNQLNYSVGIGAFDGLNTAFANIKRTSSSLKDALGTLNLKLGIASVFTSVGTAQEEVQKAETCESEKQSALSLAYDKLDALIMDTAVVDQKVSDVILSREDDFYKQYYYLKPDSKKDLVERVGDFCGDVLDGLCSIGNALLDFGRDLVEWCKEHIVAIITAVAVVLVAVVAAVFLGPAAIIAICSAIAFFCTAGDYLALLITGKDIYTLLKDSGHPILAEMFAGIQWGSTIAATALSLVQLGTQIAKVGFKGFITGGQKGFFNIIKYHAKTIFNGIKADFKSIFGKGLKVGERLKAVWNIVVLNQSGDFNFKNSILDYRNGEKVITAVTNVGFDDNNSLVVKSDTAAQALGTHVGDTVSTKKSTFVFDNTVDYNWTDYGAQKIGEVDVMKMYSEGNKSWINLDGTIDNDKLRKAIWKEAGIPSRGLSGGKTAHELYEITGGKVSFFSVDSVIHSRSVFAHNGGVSHAAQLISAIRSNNYAVKEILTIFRQTLSIAPICYSPGSAN